MRPVFEGGVQRVVGGQAPTLDFARLGALDDATLDFELVKQKAQADPTYANIANSPSEKLARRMTIKQIRTRPIVAPDLPPTRVEQDLAVRQNAQLRATQPSPLQEFGSGILPWNAGGRDANTPAGIAGQIVGGLGSSVTPVSKIIYSGVSGVARERGRQELAGENLYKNAVGEIPGGEIALQMQNLGKQLLVGGIQVVGDFIDPTRGKGGAAGKATLQKSGVGRLLIKNKALTKFLVDTGINAGQNSAINLATTGKTDVGMDATFGGLGALLGRGVAQSLRFPGQAGSAISRLFNGGGDVNYKLPPIEGGVKRLEPGGYTDLGAAAKNLNETGDITGGTGIAPTGAEPPGKFNPETNTASLGADYTAPRKGKEKASNFAAKRGQEKLYEAFTHAEFDEQADKDLPGLIANDDTRLALQERMEQWAKTGQAPKDSSYMINLTARLAEHFSQDPTRDADTVIWTRLASLRGTKAGQDEQALNVVKTYSAAIESIAEEAGFGEALPNNHLIAEGAPKLPEVTEHHKTEEAAYDAFGPGFEKWVLDLETDAGARAAVDRLASMGRKNFEYVWNLLPRIVQLKLSEMLQRMELC